MTTIQLNDDFCNLKCELQEDGPSALDVLTAFVGLMRTATFGISSIIEALEEVTDDYKESVKIAYESSDNE